VSPKPIAPSCSHSFWSGVVGNQVLEARVALRAVIEEQPAAEFHCRFRRYSTAA